MNTEPLHILLADDDESDRLLFKDALEELTTDTIVQTVNNGVLLMDYLMKEDTIMPNLLFLDLNMPQKNGLECLKEIRNNRHLSNLAVAIFSTSASEEDIEKTFLAGANIYIEKPRDFNTLKKVLDKAITATHFYGQASFDRSNFLLRI